MIEQFSIYCRSNQAVTLVLVLRHSIIINIQGQITNCPHKNARLAGENEFWRAANHIASALLLIGSSYPEAFLKLDMIY